MIERGDASRCRRIVIQWRNHETKPGFVCGSRRRVLRCVYVRGTTYAKALGDLWLKQTYDFPPEQTAKSEPGVHAEYFMGFDERRQAWVRFGVMSTGQYFAIRMTDTGDSGWSWKYVSFFKTQQPEAPGSDATFTKKSNVEYTVDGPSYEQNGTRVTEHHVCKKL
ncbi:MAG: hypothetical protein E6H64_10800 [Betaproteobacteria bacterium]|nr:MAG: hypothetical protein E6H64_10800 [Betaproteobacteria bacterium]